MSDRLIGYDSYGHPIRVGKITIDSAWVCHGLKDGIHFELGAVCDSDGSVDYYYVTPVPAQEKPGDSVSISGGKNQESNANVTTISAAELVVDYELDEMVQDESGLKVYYKKKKRTVEQLEQLLEILRNENHELKTKLNAVTDEYKLGWNAAKDEIVSTIKDLEGPT